MPPGSVKTVRDLIYYQYSKLIAKEAGYESDYKFIMAKLRELQEGRIQWSNLTREYRRESLRGKSCAYCGSAQNIVLDHLIPFSKGGQDAADNLVSVCKSCNSSKSDKDIYHWWVKDLGRDKDELPRVVAGKYLKLIYDIHQRNQTLDAQDLDGDGKLTVLDLGITNTSREHYPHKQSNQLLQAQPLTQKTTSKQIQKPKPSRKKPVGRRRRRQKEERPLLDEIMGLVGKRIKKKLGL